MFIKKCSDAHEFKTQLFGLYSRLGTGEVCEVNREHGIVALDTRAMSLWELVLANVFHWKPESLRRDTVAHALHEFLVLNDEFVAELPDEEKRRILACKLMMKKFVIFKPVQPLDFGLKIDSCSLHDRKNSGENISSLAEELEKLRLGEKLKFELSENGKTLTFHHNYHEIKALFEKNPTLSPYIFLTPWDSTQNIFNSYLSKKQLWGAYESHPKERHKIDEEVAEYFKQKPVSPVPFTAKNLTSDSLFLREVYDQFEGLCIGESHHQDSPKKFLIDHFKELKELGVTTLFLEHLFYDTIQPHLDAYLTSPKDEMHPILEAYLESLDINFEAGQYNFFEVVRAAKRAGIRVVGIDTTLSYETCSKNRDAAHGHDRISSMNYAAKRIIDHEKGDGKYIALMGGKHGSKLESNLPGRPIPGVADLLQCPFAIIQNSQRKNTQVNVTHFQNEVEFVHVVLQR